MGVDARGFPGGLLRLDPAFAYVEPPSSWPLSRAECLTLAPNSFPQRFTLCCLLDCKEIKPDNPKGNQPWMFIGRTDAEAKAPILWPPDVNEELTHWKRPWCCKRLKAGGEGNDRGWNDWMASPTQWTWVWANSKRWWRTGKPGVLKSMGSQRVGHDWATEQQQFFHYCI